MQDKYKIASGRRPGPAHARPMPGPSPGPGGLGTARVRPRAWAGLGYILDIFWYIFGNLFVYFLCSLTVCVYVCFFVDEFDWAQGRGSR